MNIPVSFGLSILLKEKGYKDTVKCYTGNGSLVTVSLTIRKFEPKKLYYPAPDIAEVVMWLYKKHKIWIYAYPVQPFNSDDKNYPKTVWIAKCLSMNQTMFEKYIDNKDNGLVMNHHRSLVEGYEAAIEYCLTLIKNQ